MINSLARRFGSLDSAELKFIFLRSLSAIFPIFIVFFSKLFLVRQVFEDFQSDYTLILFGSSIFSFGFGVVSQIVGAQKPQYKSIIVLFATVIVSFNLLLALFARDLLVILFPFSQKNSIISYLWPLNIGVAVIPNYYLGKKDYYKFFAPTIIASICIVFGLLLFKLWPIKILIFTPLFIFNLFYIISYLFRVEQKDFTRNHFNSILLLLKRQLIPYYTAMIGIKNFQYYTILFFGNRVFGDLKLIITCFNLVNFFISSKITLYANNLLNKKVKNISKPSFFKTSVEIIRYNLVLLLLLIPISVLFPYFISSWKVLIPFSIFNIGFNISNFINQLYFALQKSQIRIIADFIGIFVFGFSIFFINVSGLNYSLNNAVYILCFSVLIIILYNLFINKRLRLYDAAL